MSPTRSNPATQSFFGLGTALDEFSTVAPEGTEWVGGTQMPTGMRLVKVKNPAGSDKAAIYYAVGTVYGVELAFEIGADDRLKELFGGTDSFDDVSTMTQAQFDQSDTLFMGSVDEIAGTTESLQAQYERDSRAAGLEAPPAWLVADQKAMATMITATNEGWSSERTYGELAKLDSFKARFAGWETVQAQLGTTSIADSIAEYTAREAAIRPLLLRYRGPDAVTSPEYVSSLIGAGWQPAEVGELLELEQEVKGDSDAFKNINAILAAQGIPELTGDDFVTLLQEERLSTADDFTPSELFEAVNDALRQTALAGQGLNIGTDLAAELGTGTSTTIQSPTDFKDEAQRVAGIVAANFNGIDAGKYGLNRDEVLRYFMGESDDPDVGRKLEKLGRERGIAAQGHAATSSFIDAEGRLRTQGYSNV